MAACIENSKRVKALRRELISAIPRVPNDKASLQALQSKKLTDLLITYIGWRLRYVAARPRNVIGLSSLASDPRAAALQPNINAFVNAVVAGADLTPYLSTLPRSKGYAPAAEQRTTSADRWADKDLVLNVMGFHHFHLGLTMETAGHMARTDHVLFASVTRDTFEIFCLFDHAAFVYEDNGTMTPERLKLWSIYQAREAARALPGQLMIGGYANLGVTLSSQPMAVTRAAQRHVRIVGEVEPRLDDPAYVRTFYQDGTAPAKPKLKWHYRHLDFGLLEQSAGKFFLLERGPN